MGLRLLLLLVCIALLLLTGCAAFGDHNVLLTYRTTNKSNAVKKKIFIYVGDFENSMNNPQQIASIKTIHGSEVGTISATNDIGSWARDAVISELVAAGFFVLDSNTNMDSKSTYENVLTGKVLTVYSNAYAEYEGEVSMQFKFVQNGQVIFDKTYSGYGNAGTNLAVKKKEFARSITLALQELLLKLLKDIKISLNLDKEAISAQTTVRGSYVTNFQGKGSQVPVKEKKVTNEVFKKDTQSSLGSDTGQLKNRVIDKPSVINENLDPKTVCSNNKNIVILSGSRKEKNLIPKLNSHTNAIRALHRKRSSLKNDIAGSICISFKIYQDGKVGEASILQSSLKDNLLETQIIEYISDKIKFSKSIDEEITSILYKFTFNKINVRGQRIATSVVLSLLSIALSVLSLTFTMRH